LRRNDIKLLVPRRLLNEHIPDEDTGAEQTKHRLTLTQRQLFLANIEAAHLLQKVYDYTGETLDEKSLEQRATELEDEVSRPIPGDDVMVTNTGFQNFR
jgi:hypothetical protein